MKYKVHRMEINLEKDQTKLEQFLNNLHGEVVSIIPNIAKTTLFQIYGVKPAIRAANGSWIHGAFDLLRIARFRLHYLPKTLQFKFTHKILSQGHAY